MFRERVAGAEQEIGRGPTWFPGAGSQRNGDHDGIDNCEGSPQAGLWRTDLSGGKNGSWGQDFGAAVHLGQ